MAKAIHIIYIIIISVLAILLWQEREEGSLDLPPETTSTVEQTDVALENASNLEAMVGELQAQNRALEMRLAEQEQILAEMRSDVVELAHEDEPYEVGTVEEPPVDLGLEALSQAMRNAREGFLSEGDVNIRRELEPVDPDWAYPIEQDLQDFFIRQEEFRNINITSLECRTSYCEIEMELTEPGQSFNTSLLNRYLRDEEWFENGMIMAFENQEAGVATVIIESGRKID